MTRRIEYIYGALAHSSALIIYKELSGSAGYWSLENIMII